MGQRIKRLGISVKLVIGTAILIVISVFIVSYLSYIQYINDLEKQSASQVKQILTQVSMNIDTYLDDLFRLSLSPYYNEDVIDALDKKIDDNDLKFLNRERTIEQFLDQMMIYPRKDILRVFIINNERIYKSERLPSSIDYDIDYSKYDWYNLAMDNEKPIFVPTHLEQMIKKPRNIVFSVVNKLKSTRNLSRVLGVIKVDANYSGIASICKDVNKGVDSGIFIIDDSSNIIFSSIDSIPYSEYFRFYNAIDMERDSYNIVKYEGRDFLINYANTKYANWTIVGVNSLDEINKEAIRTRNNAFFMAFICALFAIALLICLIKLFLRPLHSIVTKVKKVETGDFDIEFPCDKEDEIGYLGSALNDMVRQLDTTMIENTELVKQVYEAKYLQKEAQVKNLFNQIRPHFIYNTLNMISIYVQCGKEDRAVDTINKLSSILRGLAHMDRDITLEYEIQLLNSYLSIQLSRFEGRLSYEIDIEDDLYLYTIPALIFQPIVENSVKYGCEARREPTSIHIYSTIEGDRIVFTVEDNGVGMDEKELGELRDKIYNHRVNQDELLNLENRGSGIGLVNVHKRIQLKYGGEYGLSVESKKGVGTIVRLSIPFGEEQMLSDVK